MGQKFREQIFRSSPTTPSTPNSQPPGTSPSPHQPVSYQARAVPLPLASSASASDARLRLQLPPSALRGPIPSPRLPVDCSLPPARQGQVADHPAPAPSWPATIAQAPSGLGQAASCPGQVVGCLASRIDLRLRPDGIGDDEGNASGGGHCAR